MRPDVHALVVTREKGLAEVSAGVMIDAVARNNVFIVLHEGGGVVFGADVRLDDRASVLKLDFCLLTKHVKVVPNSLTFFLHSMDDFATRVDHDGF